MSRTQLPAGEPVIRKAKSEYKCEAEPCLLQRPIGAGEPYVAVHDYAPQTNSKGKALTHLRANHFTVKYHAYCFSNSRSVDQLTAVCRYELEDLDGFSRYKEELARLLKAK